MPKDNFKKLYPTPSITFDALHKCMYCGSEERLTKEHIMPFALNGTMVFPKSSCRACAHITSKFERTVTQKMYGVLRNKRDYKSRRKTKRSRNLSVSYSTSNGVIKSIDLDLSNIPEIYLVVFLPPPGILTGTPLTEMNPEMQLSFVGDPNEIERAMSSIGSENISLSLASFPWGDFCRLLAKIAHGYLVAYIGQEGYVPFLPDLILGHSPYLSHYIGGIDGDKGVYMMSHHIQLSLLPEVDAGYFLTVNIHLLGCITMPTYQVIAAKVTDLDIIFAAINSKKDK